MNAEFKVLSNVGAACSSPAASSRATLIRACILGDRWLLLTLVTQTPSSPSAGVKPTGVSFDPEALGSACTVTASGGEGG